MHLWVTNAQDKTDTIEPTDQTPNCSRVGNRSGADPTTLAAAVVTAARPVTPIPAVASDVAPTDKGDKRKRSATVEKGSSLRGAGQGK